MPEGLEVELYRRAAQAVVGRDIESVSIPISAFARHGSHLEIIEVLTGSCFETPRRRGKLLILAHGGGELGVRFGMTGRLIVDGVAPIQSLEYASNKDLPEWDRFIVTFVDGGSMRVRDQRRLGSVELDPDESSLGVDLFDVGSSNVSSILRSNRPLKARLMDQSVVAGLGNLLTDEILWRAGLHPARPADALSNHEQERLVHEIDATLGQLMARGGSHMGDLHSERHDGGICPRDGNVLERCAVGGRTTYACPVHQRAQE